MTVHTDTTPARPTDAAQISAEAGGKAVASFLTGLIGLLVANLVLGPLAIVLGIMALRDGTGRRGRAALGIALGVADLIVFATLALHSASADHNLPVWRFGSF